MNIDEIRQDIMVPWYLQMITFGSLWLMNIV